MQCGLACLPYWKIPAGSTGVEVTPGGWGIATGGGWKPPVGARELRKNAVARAPVAAPAAAAKMMRAGIAVRVRFG